MVGVKASITRWVSDDQPGFVEFRFTDAHGQVRAFIEKAPVVTLEELDASSEFPRACAIACTVLGRAPGCDGREIVTIDTSNPWGVGATDGMTVFEVQTDQLVEMDTGYRS
jgi:hypothetical protein